MRHIGKRLLDGGVRCHAAGWAHRGAPWSSPARCAPPCAHAHAHQLCRGSASSSSRHTGAGDGGQRAGAAQGRGVSGVAGVAAVVGVTTTVVASTAVVADPGRPGGATPPSACELAHRVDHYNGVIVDPSGLPDTEAQFVAALQASLAQWRAAGRRGVWLQVPLAQASYVGLAVAAGFVFHHAEPGHCMLTHWLPGGPSPLPANASHQVGVGAFVLNSAGHVLVVQERTGPAARPGFWKLPTGLAEAGEDIAQAAVREVLEETGVRTRFSSVIGFRQAHGMAFDKSDLFFLCGLTLEDPTQMALTPQESEIADAKWMSLEDFSKMPHVKDENTVWGHLHALCRAWAQGTYSGIQAAELPVGFRPGRNTVFHARTPAAGDQQQAGKSRL